MREAIHALRCIFWCLRGTQSTRIDQTAVAVSRASRPLCICILAFSRSSFATEQFQRKPHKFSDLHCPFSRWYPL
ncbi:hypothetical protein GBAR_LOCUS3576 [Geodia barretti]|uniref:Uncharacterized protein n=1 Tax=Geodia barretti TaxID=519541 RepID=A0AA35W1M5_GEOBA|nr:hypothetical protein GBAR_LOCUS3576 [Geodia barretti]